MAEMKLVTYGVDTLILNVRYSDSQAQPLKQEVAEKLAQELDYLQGEARRFETVVATDWVFRENQKAVTLPLAVKLLYSKCLPKQ
jgi:hypothetical protein